jgi:hypothetical protein
MVLSKILRRVQREILLYTIKPLYISYVLYVLYSLYVLQKSFGFFTVGLESISFVTFSHITKEMINEYLD